MRNILSAILLVTVLTAFSQKIPVISSISPSFGNVGETLTIVGSGFPTSAANVQVKIGSGIAQVTSIQESLIEVTIPANASGGKVKVLDLNTGLMGESFLNFNLSFGGDNFDNARVSTPTDIDTEEFFIWELCDCDFDGDGKTDIAVSSRENDGTAKAKRKIYRNTSTLSAISLVEADEVGLKPAVGITCGDLDGDGKPEIISGQVNDDDDSGEQNLEIFLNGSTSGTISFQEAPTVQFTLPRSATNEIRRPVRIRLADLDFDGKIDIVTSNDTDGTLHIFKNTSTVSNLSFETPIEINTGLSEPIVESFTAGDLNNDNLPDLVAADFETSELFVFENISTGNGISFKDPVEYTSTAQFRIRDIVVTDLNKDGFNDLAASSLASASAQSVLIYLLNETGTDGQEIVLSDFNTFNFSNNVFGLTTGDADGDGQVDMIASILSADSPGISVLTSSFSNGTVSFSESKFPMNDIVRFTRLIDLNGDAKPDFVSTVDSRQNQNTTGLLSVVKNNNCILPAISETSAVYCPGNTFLVEARNAINVTYNWEVSQDGGTTFNSVKQNTDNFLDISTFNTDLQVKVTLTGSDGCSIESSVGTFELNNNTPSNPTINDTNPLCVGDPITLTSPTTADEYFWTGPDGFSAETTTSTIEVTASAESVNAGTYRLRVKNTDGCLSQEVTETVIISSPPKPTITIDGGLDFCADASKTLTTTTFPGFSTQWNLNGTAISDATSTSLIATEGGEYSVTLTDDVDGCTNTSLTSTLSAIEVPQSEITVDAQICVDVPLDVVGNSTNFNPDYTLLYEWSFTDDNNNEVASSNDLATTVTFDQIGTYTASLTTSYSELAGCSSIQTQSIEVLGPDNFEISPEGNTTEKCPSDSVLLEVPEGYFSYNWSDGSTGNSTYATTGLTESQVTVSIEAISTIGCTVTDEITISNFPNSGFTVSSGTEGTEITDSLIVMPDGELSINLEAGGGNNFTWQPEDIFDNPNAASVTVFPKSPSTDIILSGTDNNGCNESESYILQNNSVAARKSFSPDGNNLGFDCWEIINLTSTGSCTVYVFDKRGRNIFVNQGPFDSDCVWDGNITGGAQAPEGVYYFVLKCDDENSKQFEQSGSFVLARDN